MHTDHDSLFVHKKLGRREWVSSIPGEQKKIILLCLNTLWHFKKMDQFFHKCSSSGQGRGLVNPSFPVSQYVTCLPFPCNKYLFFPLIFYNNQLIFQSGQFSDQQYNLHLHFTPFYQLVTTECVEKNPRRFTDMNTQS